MFEGHVADENDRDRILNRTSQNTLFGGHMRTAKLLVFVLGIMILPASGQATKGVPSIVGETPILFTASVVLPAEWKPFSTEGDGGVSAALLATLPQALTYVSPIAPSAILASRSMVQPEVRKTERKTMEWKLSLLALAAAHSADAATSWNKRELNPMLSPNSGAFGLQTLAIKCAISAGSIGLQLVLLKRHPELVKWFARINFVESGVIGATAMHNSFVPGR